MFVYLITNEANGKRYVGLAINPRLRWKAHLSRAFRDNPDYAISRAIAKYGAHLFRFEVVACCNNWDDLKATERALIGQNRTLAPSGYNMTEGGDGTLGYRHTKSAKETMRAKRLGAPVSSETRAKISIGGRGKVRTEATRERISQASRLRGGPSSEATAKAAAKLRGAKLSAEHRAKLSAAGKGRKKSQAHKDAIGRAHLGMVHTVEAKLKIAAAARARARQQSLPL